LENALSVEAILIDFGGTLDSDGLDWYESFYRICQEQGMLLDRDEFERLGKIAGRRISRHDDVRELKLDVHVHRLVAELREIMDDEVTMDPVQTSETFLARASMWLNSHLPIVEQLAAEFRLGCLSNNWGNAQGWCEQFGFFEHMEVAVDSTLVGVSKPDRRIFEIGLKRLDLPAEKVAYVGDRYETDMEGAKGAGLTTVWVSHPHYENDVDEGIADYAIRSFSEMLEIVEQWK
jgi:putative hydrolase of the HAD superfamily